ncbi:MAG: recombinase family protein, partial [Butyricicoccus sp.]|nr:recombinase family protein [Butyricicoccus sp.]
MKIGYIRTSTVDQNTARQEVLMRELGVEQVYIDRMSGKSMDRPELKRMMSFVRCQRRFEIVRKRRRNFVVF